MGKKHSLKKFFTLIAVWFLVIVAIVVGSNLYSSYENSDYDALAIPYLEKAVPELSQWDTAKTRALMPAEVSEAIPEERFSEIMVQFSRLGALQSMAAPKVEAVHKNQATKLGKETIIEYEIAAKYANGDALLNIQLLQREGSFQIFHFNLSSKVLAN